MTTRQTIIDIATKEIGYKESPPKSNLNKFGKWYGMDGLAWCAMFVSWVYDQAGVPLGHIDDNNGFRYCPSALIYWRRNDKITLYPAPGDIVLFDWNVDKKSDHTGIFVKWIETGKTFETIEGNTSSSNQSDGGEVERRTRKVSQVSAFINPLEIPYP